MKKTKGFYILLALITAMCIQIQAQESIIIKGTVKFIDKDFKMSVYQRIGTTKKVLAEAPVNEDHTYTLTVPVENPGEAIVDCGKWQTVNVWLENENLDIDFRGLDTAKIKIMIPPLIFTRGGFFFFIFGVASPRI